MPCTDTARTIPKWQFPSRVLPRAVRTFPLRRPFRPALFAGRSGHRPPGREDRLDIRRLTSYFSFDM